MTVLIVMTHITCDDTSERSDIQNNEVDNF